MRGEYSALFHPRLAGMELPPHARRIRSVNRRRIWICGTTSACAENTAIMLKKSVRVGTTSACAENTKQKPSRCRTWWNYLRMRGEYFVRFCPTQATVELPPHARRILGGAFRHLHAHGTTSACAENTQANCRSGQSHRNYLRMRGEYARTHTHQPHTLELPPHARRIHFSASAGGHWVGTTSACAENTRQHPLKIDSDWNYLRMRGEYPALSLTPT